MLRRQALPWLRDDLALYAKAVEGGGADAIQAAPEGLAHWQRDADLAPVRDPRALGPLPEGERQAWRRPWDDVAALLLWAGAAP
jgi:hypothetical protein